MNILVMYVGEPCLEAIREAEAARTILEPTHVVQLADLVRAAT